MNSINSLVQLQEIDSQLVEISELLGDLPVKVDELTQDEQKTINDINKQKQRLKKIDLEISKMDLQVKEYVGKIDKLKDQLFLVKTNKQYDALSQEIDFLKEALYKIEMVELELVEEKESLSAETEERRNNLESFTSDLHSQKETLESLIAESSEKKANLEKGKTAITSNLPEDVVAKYERVFNARDGVAIIEVYGDSCGGCGASLPPQQIAELKQGKGIHNCDVCSRFLYWP